MGKRAVTDVSYENCAYARSPNAFHQKNMRREIQQIACLNVYIKVLEVLVQVLKLSSTFIILHAFTISHRFSYIQ